MFFKHENSVEKQLLNIRNAFVSHHCFRNPSLSAIRYNLGMSNYKRMTRPRNLEFRKKTPVVTQKGIIQFFIQKRDLFL